MQYRFEGYVLDCALRELRRGTELIAVEPQVLDLLSFLIDHRDRVVSKDDLMAAIWNRRIVSESALTSRINSARAALSDSGEEQRLIKTLRGRGFRFVGAVSGALLPSNSGESGHDRQLAAAAWRSAVDRGAAVRQHERRSCPRLLRRWDERGDHHGPGAV